MSFFMFANLNHACGNFYSFRINFGYYQVFFNPIKVFCFMLFFSGKLFLGVYKIFYCNGFDLRKLRK